MKVFVEIRRNEIVMLSNFLQREIAKTFGYCKKRENFINLYNLFRRFSSVSLADKFQENTLFQYLPEKTTLD
jgi:hypothetical protein